MIVQFLAENAVDNRICLKIVLDKWLLQQPLFRGYYTRNVTFSALLKLFVQRDARIESLMVIGYNPSHTNINSEVNAPFKILSLLVRYLENEISPKKGKRPPQSYDDGDEEEETGILLPYSLPYSLPIHCPIHCLFTASFPHLSPPSTITIQRLFSALSVYNHCH